MLITWQNRATNTISAELLISIDRRHHHPEFEEFLVNSLNLFVQRVGRNIWRVLGCTNWSLLGRTVPIKTQFKLLIISWSITFISVCSNSCDLCHNQAMWEKHRWEYSGNILGGLWRSFLLMVSKETLSNYHNIRLRLLQGVTSPVRPTQTRSTPNQTVKKWWIIVSFTDVFIFIQMFLS